MMPAHRACYRRHASFLLITAPFAGCSSFQASPSPSDAGGDASPLVDGGGPPPFDANANANADAEAGSGVNCSVLVDEDFHDHVASSQAWNFLGSAKVAQDADEAELVPAQGSQAGVMWRTLKTPLPPDVKLHVHFTSSIT